MTSWQSLILKSYSRQGGTCTISACTEVPFLISKSIPSANKIKVSISKSEQTCFHSNRCAWLLDMSFFSFPNQFQICAIKSEETLFGQQERWLLVESFFLISLSVPSAKESKYPRRKHVFTAREMSPARVLFSHFQMTIKSKYLRKHLCTAREMASGGVLVFSFPCLNSEESPDQLRFIPIPRKRKYEEWTLRSLLVSFLFVLTTKRDGDTV